jgi:hypothetical protein
MASYAHGGAAFVLLALPAWDAAQADKADAAETPIEPPAAA